MRSRKPRYKVGDRVRIQSIDYIKNSSKPHGDHYTFVGESEDSLCFNKLMFKYCGEVTTITFATDEYDFPQYLVTAAKRKHFWNEEMLVSAVSPEEQRKIREHMGIENNSFNKELLCAKQQLLR